MKPFCIMSCVFPVIGTWLGICWHYNVIWYGIMFELNIKLIYERPRHWIGLLKSCLWLEVPWNVQMCLFLFGEPFLLRMKLISITSAFKIITLLSVDIGSSEVGDRSACMETIGRKESHISYSSSMVFQICS